MTAPSPMPSPAPSTEPATANDARPCRILIVDDSAVARAVMARIVGDDGRYVVAGAAASADAALALLAQTAVDVILLDLELPGIHGLTALPDLIVAGRGARVLIVSSSCDAGGAAAVQALALGAADTLAKPAPGALAGRFADALSEKLARLSEQAAVAVAVPATTPSSPRPAGDAVAMVAIGASTGGIYALSQLLRALPAHFDAPILVTQHLPSAFTPYFAAQVAVFAGRPCDVAEDRLRVRPGRVVVAPGDAHLTCVPLGDGSVGVRLSTEAAASHCLPSADPMFASLAPIFGARLLAIVLSGMGRDGTVGARAVRDAGGTIVVQDRETSAVWGMPGAIAAAGLADAVLPADAIGRYIADRGSVGAGA